VALIPDLGRRLYELERVVDTVHPGGIPAALSVLLFEDDDSVAFRAYTDDLERWCRERGAGDTVLVTITQLCQRPPGLHAPWMSPRAWLEYRPSAEELAQLRPDTVGPREPRADYTVPDGGPAIRVAAAALQAPPARASEGPARALTEDEQRTREARQRWQAALRRDGTAGADWMVGGASPAPTVAGRTAASGSPADVLLEQGPPAFEIPELPLQVDEVLRLGGGRRPGPLAVPLEVGPLGRSAR
jgi:hypothetical protein